MEVKSRASFRHDENQEGTSCINLQIRPPKDRMSMNDLFDLTSRVVVITGAAGLLGRQHADAIASGGGIPILLDLNEEEVHKLAQKLEVRYSIAASGYAVDITSEKAVEQCKDQILGKYGKIDGLINNAASNPIIAKSLSKQEIGRLENFAMSHWQQDLAVGLTGSFICTKYFI